MAQMTPSTAKPLQTPGKVSPRARSFSKNDFPFIRTASIILASSVTASAIMVVGSSFLLSSMQNSKDQAESQLNQVRQQFSQAETERKEIHDFQPKYVRMLERGFIGDEKRLDWIEHMKKVQKNRQLLPINFEISPQQIVQVDPSVLSGELELHGSKMSLHMNLLHEMDLLNFLQELKSIGTTAPQSCIIKQTTLIGDEALQAHLIADCTLYWLTLGKPAAAVDASSAAPAGGASTAPAAPTATAK